MSSSVLNEWTLPLDPPYVAPRYDFKSQWYRQDDAFDLILAGKIERAFIVSCIGEHVCPTPAEHTLVILGGCVTATLADHYVSPLSNVLVSMASAPHCEHIWEAVWRASEIGAERLPKPLLAALLYLFEPQRHDPSHDRPYYLSRLESSWKGIMGVGYRDNIVQSTCNIRLERLDAGRRALNELPPEIKTALEDIGQHGPIMLRRVLEQVRADYQ